MESSKAICHVTRVRENAAEHNVAFEEELLRVMSHGFLHCLGYKDKTKKEQQDMRAAEQACMELFHVEQNNANHVS